MINSVFIALIRVEDPKRCSERVLHMTCCDGKHFDLVEESKIR